MRSDLPARVADAIDRARGATLIFDAGAIAATMQRVRDAAHASGISALFAAKSFPHPRVRALAAELLDGFDVASPGELAEVDRSKIISVMDPSGAAIAAARGGRVIVGVETLEQLQAAPPGAEIALRISASITGRDPAIGAVLDGTGHRRSRFGLDDRAQLAELARAAHGRRIGLHVHHGPITAASAERFVATARAALALVDVEPAFLDLGGAWHGLPDLAGALAQIRAAIPASIELLIEPGRLYADGAGFATGAILASREIGDRVLVVSELSRICHLRWSQVELVARAPRPGHGVHTLIAGPTCYEEDVIGEWIVEELARVTVRGVSGYAAAWNTSFGGLSPASIVFV